MLTLTDRLTCSADERDALLGHMLHIMKVMWLTRSFLVDRNEHFLAGKCVSISTAVPEESVLHVCRLCLRVQWWMTICWECLPCQECVYGRVPLYSVLRCGAHFRPER